MTKKRPILDPWFSRPIDWHRTINSPQAVALIDDLWQGHFQPHDKPRPGPKPRTAFKDQFAALLVELLLAWLEDPELSLGVPFSVNAYDTRSRYNAPGMSKAIIPMMRTLQEAGLLDVADGSYGGAGKGGNRNTRVRASVALRERFRGLGARPDDFSRRVDQECIVLRDGDVGLVDYTDTPETNAMRAHLRAYNDVLAAAFIDVSTAEGHRVVTGGDRGQSIGPQHHFIHRVFSRGRWDCNGRFYGGWWQHLGSDIRRHILINNTPTVEVDFRGMHLNILAAQAGVTLTDDPYAIDVPDNLSLDAGELRKVVKRLVLTALNARDRDSAFRSFRDLWPTGHIAKTLTNAMLNNLVDKIEARHPFLDALLFSDRGIGLMNIDAQIADLVHLKFRSQEIRELSWNSRPPSPARTDARPAVGKSG